MNKVIKLYLILKHETNWCFRRLLVGVALSVYVCSVAYIAGFRAESKTSISNMNAIPTASAAGRLSTFGKLSKDDLHYLCEQSKASGINCHIALALTKQESRGDPWVGSNAGAMGLMQVMPATAKSLCKEVKSPNMLWDTRVNIRCGLKVLSYCLQEHKGDVFKALYCYNGSPVCAEKCRKEGSAIVCVNKCEETFNYARSVVRKINELDLEEQ